MGPCVLAAEGAKHQYVILSAFLFCSRITQLACRRNRVHHVLFLSCILSEVERRVEGEGQHSLGANQISNNLPEFAAFLRLKGRISAL